MVLESLVSWKRMGNLLVVMKRFRRKVLKIQKFWRWCHKHLAKICKTVERQWIPVEREFLIEKLERHHIYSREGSRGTKPSQDGSRPSVAGLVPSRPSISEQVPSHLTLGLEERIDVAMLDHHRRHRFLIAELRVCRYEALPAIKHWEDSMEAYHEEVRQWRETRAACKVIGVVNTMRVPMMPPCPKVSLPTRLQLIDMVERAHNPHAHPRQVKVLRKFSNDATTTSKRADFLVLSQPSPPGSAQGARSPSESNPNLPRPLCLL